ncbi:MAG: hypothetical protein NVSMB65_18930 [Chloroflexota bacterium]
MEEEQFTEEVGALVDAGPGVVLVFQHQDDEEKWIQIAVADRTEEAFGLSVALGMPHGTTPEDLKGAVQVLVDALAGRWGGTFECGLFADEEDEEA